MKWTLNISAIILSGLLSITFCSEAQEYIPAQPRGGERLAREFIDEEMIYPPLALKNSVQGDVVFDFIIQEQGLVKNLVIEEPVDPLLKKEAIRLFNLIIWEPAEYRGKAVESKKSYSFRFNIRNYKKACRNRGYDTFPFPTENVDSSGTIYQYKYVDVQPFPFFQEEDSDLQKFMAENFTYPEEALKRNITGIVKLNFIVEPHGRISNIRTIEHVGAGCTEEAIRLVKLLKWKAGIYNGKSVRVTVNMPITFGLNSDGGSYKVAPAAGQTTFQ